MKHPPHPPSPPTPPPPTHTHTHFCSYGRCSFLNAENSLNTFFFLLFDIIPAMKGLILAAVVT